MSKIVETGTMVEMGKMGKMVEKWWRFIRSVHKIKVKLILKLRIGTNSSS